MNNECNHKNPLKRSGANQYQRVLKALLPDFVKVDERDHADLILFAKNYASCLKYFDKSNAHTDNWSPFMSMDISVTLASLIKLDIENYYAYTNKIFGLIESTEMNKTVTHKKYFKTLFDLAFSITHNLNQFYEAIPDDFDFKEIIKNSVHSTLPEYFDRVKNYYNEAIAQNLIDPSGTFQFPDSPIDLILAQEFDEITLSDIWEDISISPFAPTYNGSTIVLKIKNTATHNLFTGIFDSYLKVYSGIIKSASGYLDQTLLDFPSHSPHYALYLVFIKLFRFVQVHLNEMTARHLDFYYKQILRLENKDAESDQVHLTFELSKTAEDSILVEKDTVFKAGKDIDDEEIFYVLTDDVVLGKATVSELKNVYVSKDLTQGTKQVLASSVANSEDGLGSELTSTDLSWKTFGYDTRTYGEIGFVIASSYLYLKEGSRKITFKFYAPSGELIIFNEDVINNSFSLKLSGEEGWLDVSIQTGKVTIDAGKEFFSIEMSLDAGDPAIVPYEKEIHGNNFSMNLPMALFTLKDAEAKDSLWDFEFEKVGLDLDVSGVKDLVIENDEGILNPAKPFNLFGSSPYVGSSFMVNSKELFMKALQPSANIQVDLSLEWDDYEDFSTKVETNNTHTVAIEYLENAGWKTAESKVMLFNTTESLVSDFVQQKVEELYGTIALTTDQSAPSADSQSPQPNQMDSASSHATETNSESLQQVERTEMAAYPAHDVPSKLSMSPSSVINFDLSQMDVEEDYSNNENYSTQSKWGFFRLKLNDPDFGHPTYANDLADAAKGATITSTEANGVTTSTITIIDVDEPYTPKVKEISLGYTVSTELTFSSDPDGKFMQITPFGFTEIAGSDLPGTLLPAFENEGELYIGLDKLQTGQTLPILFQVAEGTADPLTETQNVNWYYLDENNSWIAFESEEISDSTNGLIKSGIIKFSIPDDIAFQNTLMDSELSWLKVTVAEKTQAICNMIAVKAQAAVAQFYDYKNTSNYFKSTLPEGSITKLVISDASIKKIEQPFASFGGRTKEDDTSYYQRISERVRHKARAISMWDYERLVLEEFPEIYKVKCINHTQIIEKSSGTQIIHFDNEMKPGHVIVVPIPDLHNQNAYDPLRPYTSLGLLDDIKSYLYDKVSPHVKLDVRNPKFEEIQMEFNVQYLTDDIDLYTIQLKQDLEEFLAPWAYDENTDIEFGGKVSKSALINFIEERSYVDHLSCVKMFHIVDGVKSNELEEIYATSSRSVFVSVKSDDPVNSHKINETTCEC